MMSEKGKRPAPELQPRLRSHLLFRENHTG